MSLYDTYSQKMRDATNEWTVAGILRRVASDQSLTTREKRQLMEMGRNIAFMIIDGAEVC